MQTTIAFDATKATSAIKRIQQFVRNKSVLNNKIANLLKTTTQTRFSTKTAPDGTKWQKYAPTTRKPADQLLIGKTKTLSKIVGRYSNNTITITTSAPYGNIHQFGGSAGRGGKTKIPARPFLGISPNDNRAIINLMRNHIRSLTNG